MRLNGKVALISGAAKGMGAEHARAIVKEGGKVVLGDILDAANATLATELGAANALAVHLDVTNTQDWAKAVEAGEAKFGKIDVLINNAGILHAAPIAEYSDADWDRIIAINLTGAMKGIRAVTPAMRRAGSGSIINISSTAGIKAFAGILGYVTAKFGLRGMTKAAAIELAADRIRVNSIHPGNIETDMTAGLYQSLRHVPMERMGTPAEISNLMIYLASDESSFSTGAEFVADGGETAGMPNLF